uniref:G domain-containing protein n=1 Tax=Panagrolaimus sp. JU765 TaxID=591449 RepID=A0AC34QLZ9_9BILA
MADSRLAPKTITVLILGQTGRGKSTFINSAANYLKYSNLDEALRNQPVCVIPTRFLHNIRNPGPNEESEIVIEMPGMNANDRQNEFGQPSLSATKQPRVYSFVQGDVHINLIDVPGIGDTGGVLVDAQNKSRIMEKIKKFDKIHAVWIFLMAKETRATTEFLFCLRDIFTVVPKTAIGNVAFVITNTRSENYTPGETTSTLNTFIDTLNKEYGLQIDKSTSKYSVDSEAFRYLVGSCTNQKFKENVAKHVAQYRESWEVSRAEFFRLLKAAFAATAQPTRHYKFHTHVFYNIQNILKCMATKPKTDAEIENDVKLYVENLKVCKSEIMNCVYTAYTYLYQNSIFVFNESFEEKVKIEIRVQEANKKVDRNVVENLQKVLEDHKRTLRTLEPIRQRIGSQNIKQVTEDDFEQALEKVFRLPFYGPALKKVYESERESAELSTIDFTPLPVNHLLANVS